MHKHVNLFLVILVALFFVYVSALSLYYQVGITKVNDQSDVYSQNLTRCSTELGFYRTQFEQTSQSLNSSERDIKVYDTIFQEKSAELEDKKAALQSTKVDLESTKSSLNRFKDLYEQEKTRGDTLQREKQVLQTEISTVQKEVLKWKKEANDFKDAYLQCSQNN